ncbi:hypothetical protein AAVH_08445 [Aphelenchoides avenae]|nr:hypothetical protein AAVH_08445 [Aphelenchus avenae]
MPQYGLVALFLLAATSIDARVPAGLAMFSSDNSFRRPPVPPPRLEATCLQFPWLRRCQGADRKHVEILEESEVTSTTAKPYAALDLRPQHPLMVPYMPYGRYFAVYSGRGR